MHVSIQEQDCAERLVLGGCSDLALVRQVGNESLHFVSCHVVGMALVVEEDEALDPVDISLLGAVGIVLHAQDFTSLIQ